LLFNISLYTSFNGDFSKQENHKKRRAHLQKSKKVANLPKIPAALLPEEAKEAVKSPETSAALPRVVKVFRHDPYAAVVLTEVKHESQQGE